MEKESSFYDTLDIKEIINKTFSRFIAGEYSLSGLSEEDKDNFEKKMNSIKVGQTYRYNTNPNSKMVTILKVVPAGDGYVARDLKSKKTVTIKGENIYKLTSPGDGGKEDEDKGEKEVVNEETLTPKQKKKREEIVKSLKKDMEHFKKKYGDDAEDVIYATATKLAKG